MEIEIYELSNSLDEMKYIGSSNDAERRMVSHLSCVNTTLDYCDTKLYLHWRELVKAGHAMKMKVLRKCVVKNKTEQRTEEQTEMKRYPPEMLLNEIRAIATKEIRTLQQRADCKRYYEKHREARLAQVKEYREAHLDEIKQKNKDRYAKRKAEDPEWVAREKLRKSTQQRAKREQQKKFVE